MRKPIYPNRNGGDRRRASGDFASLHGWPGHERDFFERAGDELRAWFGDDPAPRPGKPDHRGRGPIDHIRPDERIRDHVNDVLTEDGWIDASGIRVAVEDGEVTLTGRVDDKSAKRRAADLARSAPGVMIVQNALRVEAAFFAP